MWRECQASTPAILRNIFQKDRPECLYRSRLWAGFGKSWDWTKVKDIVRETLLGRIYRACKQWKNWTGRGQFFERMDLVWQIMTLTIEHSWPIGCGPGGVPYDKCGDDFLVVQPGLDGKIPFTSELGPCPRPSSQPLFGRFVVR